MKKYYIGLSVTYHDPGLAIVDDNGEVLFAEATERYLQSKRAINCEPDQLNWITDVLDSYCSFPCEFVVATNWRKKRPHYERLISGLGLLTAKGLLKKDLKKLRSPLENYKLHHMIACQHSSYLKTGLNLVRRLKEFHPDCPVSFLDFDHHLTHAAMASYSSPFNNAACAVIDSYGENGSMAFYRYHHGKLERIHETRGIGSLGFYYMKITELCGFDWLKGEEWKVMGLAAYGKLDQKLYDLFKETLAVDGFDFAVQPQHFFDLLEALNAYQQKEEDALKKAADLAFTGQYFFAELMTQILKHLKAVTGEDNLVLAGGCALNSSYNGQITERTGFKQAHIPSAPADDGTALGAAWLAYHRTPAKSAKPPQLLTPYLGSRISNEAINRLIQYNRSLDIRHLPDTLCEETAQLLASGAIVGWVQDRAEFGPRSLGNRSILADPRGSGMKDTINQHIKFREYFRPFAPSVLHEYGPEYFENYQESPYMDKTLTVKPAMRERIAATAHVDGTGRLQTVKEQWNPRFYRLISHFHALTGVPVLLNTSFNVMGKPLIHSLEDAVSVFLTTGLDALVIDDYLITKPHDRNH
jgi:carbamoyltransferase